MSEEDISNQSTSEHLLLQFTDWHRSPSPMNSAEVDLSARNAAQRAKELESEIAREAVAAEKVLIKPEPNNNREADMENDAASNDIVAVPGHVPPERNGDASSTMLADRAKAKLARRKALRKKQLKHVSRLDHILEILDEESTSSGEEILKFNKPVMASRPPFVSQSLQSKQEPVLKPAPLGGASSTLRPGNGDPSDKETLNVFEPILSNDSVTPSAAAAPSRPQPLSRPTSSRGPPSQPQPITKYSLIAKRLEAIRRKLTTGRPSSFLKPPYKTSWPYKDEKANRDGPIQSPLARRLRRKQPDIIPSFQGLVEVVDKRQLPPLRGLLDFDGSERSDTERPAKEESEVAGASRFETLRKKLEDGQNFSLVEALDEGHIPLEEKMVIADPLPFHHSPPKKQKSPDGIKSRTKKYSIRAGSSRVTKVEEAPRLTASEEGRKLAAMALSKSKTKVKSTTKSRFKAKARRRRARRTQLQLLLEAAGPNHQKKMRTRSEQYYTTILDVLMDREAQYESDDE